MTRTQSGAALVVGGSRGLGLLIAKHLLANGLDVILAGRDSDSLGDAKEFLGESARVDLKVCDIRDRQAVQELIHYCESRQTLNVVISVAGIIQVGPAESFTYEQFDDAIATMLEGPINVAWAALPGMRKRGHGRIGTVTSVGGMVAPPHLLPYVTAKFGAVGFSDGLAAELAGTGVTATTVVPGLMRTGSHEQAYFAGDAPAEYAWFSAAASLPLLSMDADRAAKRIVDGVLKGSPQVVLTPLAWLGIRVRGLFPGTTIRLMGVANRLLPDPKGEPGDLTKGVSAKKGLGEKASSIVDKLTVLGERASRRYNQRNRAVSEPGGTIRWATEEDATV